MTLKDAKGECDTRCASRTSTVLDFYGINSPLVLQEEPQKRLCNHNAIVGLAHPRHSVLVHRIVEDALAVPRLDDFGYYVLGELRVALHRDEPSSRIHALYAAPWGRAQLFNPRRILVDDVPVHLMDVLHRRQSRDLHPVHHPVTHELLQPEQLLARLRKVDGHDGHLPTDFAPVDLDAHRPADDLMPEAHADDADSLLLQELLDEIHKLDDPRIIVESVLLYVDSSAQPRMVVAGAQLAHWIP